MKQPLRYALMASACLVMISSLQAHAAGPKAASASQVAAQHEAELMRRLDQLAGEVESLKSQLAEIKAQAPVAAAPTAVPPVANATTPAVTSPVAATNVANGGDVPEQSAHGEPATVFTGYAELNYNRYRQDAAQSQADMRRFVLGYQHRFDAKTKAVAELEVEHAVTSADGDPGEVEVEQAYAERQLNSQWALRAGLFLMPAGLLNENHEPTGYYGVERNAVETAIIPSTWREGGVQLRGQFGQWLDLARRPEHQL